MTSETDGNEDGYLTGQFLIAMPTIGDPRFERTLIYLCAHSADGAMGLIVNRLADEIDFEELLDQLEVEHDGGGHDIRVHVGGPVETGRGFVLHTLDYQQESTLVVPPQVGLTATVDILRAIAEGRGPAHCLLALGYAGWAAGQLETEIQSNGWLNAPADLALLFDDDVDSKWSRALGKVGVDLSFLSSHAGHA